MTKSREVEKGSNGGRVEGRGHGTQEGAQGTGTGRQNTKKKGRTILKKGNTTPGGRGVAVLVIVVEVSAWEGKW